MTIIKSKSEFEFQQLHSSQMKNNFDKSLYDRPKNTLKKLKSDINFDVNEMYNLSQVSKEEMDFYKDKRERDIYMKVRERRLAGGHRPLLAKMKSSLGNKFDKENDS